MLILFAILAILYMAGGSSVMLSHREDRPFHHLRSL